MIDWIEEKLEKMDRSRSWLCSHVGISPQRYHTWVNGSRAPFSEVASIAIFLAKELRQNEKDVWYEMLQAHKGEQDA
jgi:hypothetical protein